MKLLASVIIGIVYTIACIKFILFAATSAIIFNAFFGGGMVLLGIVALMAAVLIWAPVKLLLV